MFDRLFNILKANINHAVNPDQDINQEVDAILKQMNQTNRMHQEQQQFENFVHQQQQKPLYSKEELEAYTTLELKAGASLEEVKASYKSLMKKYHPDRFHNDKDKYKTALEITQKVNRAYDILEKKLTK